MDQATIRPWLILRAAELCQVPRLDSPDILLAPHRLKVRQISCVSERIQYHDTVLWMVLQPIVNEARTNEAGATSN